MVYFLSKALARSGNETHLAKLRPSVRNEFRKFLNDIINFGYTPVIRDSTRTRKQQAYYKRIDKRNASPGYSTHEKGTGIDLDIYRDGKLLLSKNTPFQYWIISGIPNLAKNKYKMRWGGNFKNYPDNNHFDFLTA